MIRFGDESPESINRNGKLFYKKKKVIAQVHFSIKTSLCWVCECMCVCVLVNFNDYLMVRSLHKCLMTAICFWSRMQHKQPELLIRQPKSLNWPMGRWMHLGAIQSLRLKRRPIGHRRRNVVLCARQRNLLHRTNVWHDRHDGLSSFPPSSWPESEQNKIDVKTGNWWRLQRHIDGYSVDCTANVFSYLESIGADACNWREFSVDFGKQWNRFRCLVRALQREFCNERNLTDNRGILRGKRGWFHRWIGTR